MGWIRVNLHNMKITHIHVSLKRVNPCSTNSYNSYKNLYKKCYYSIKKTLNFNQNKFSFPYIHVNFTL